MALIIKFKVNGWPQHWPILQMMLITFMKPKPKWKPIKKTDNKTIRQSPNLRQCKHKFHISLWNLCGIFPGYIYEGDGSGYWDISLDFLTPVERNENALFFILIEKESIWRGSLFRYNLFRYNLFWYILFWYNLFLKFILREIAKKKFFGRRRCCCVLILLALGPGNSG